MRRSSIPRRPTSSELDRVRTKTINGFIRVPADALTKGEIVYRGDNATNSAVGATLQKNVTRAVLMVRGADLNLSPQQLQDLLSTPSIRRVPHDRRHHGRVRRGHVPARLHHRVHPLHGDHAVRHQRAAQHRHREVDARRRADGSGDQAALDDVGEDPRRRRRGARAARGVVPVRRDRARIPRSRSCRRSARARKRPACCRRSIRSR